MSKNILLALRSSKKFEESCVAALQSRPPLTLTINTIRKYVSMYNSSHHFTSLHTTSIYVPSYEAGQPGPVPKLSLSAIASTDHRFSPGKKVSRRASRPPNTPRGRHRAGRGRTERRRPQERCLTCLLTDPRGRFGNLPRAHGQSKQDQMKRPKPPSSRSRTIGMCAHTFVPRGSG